MSDHEEEIRDLCALARMPELAEDFIAREFTIEQVRKELLYIRSHQPDEENYIEVVAWHNTMQAEEERRAVAAAEAIIPDWGFWGQIPMADVGECVLLSLGIEPRVIDHENFDWMNARPEIKNRVDVAIRNIESEFLKSAPQSRPQVGRYVMVTWRELANATSPFGLLNNRIHIPVFVAWAQSVGWEIPPELAAMEEPALARNVWSRAEDTMRNLKKAIFSARNKKKNKQASPLPPAPLDDPEQTIPAPTTIKALQREVGLSDAESGQPATKQDKAATSARNDTWRALGEALLNDAPNRTIRDIAVQIAKEYLTETGIKIDPATVEKEALRGIKKST